MRTIANLTLTVALLLGMALASAQSVPDLVNYQGTLLRPDGTAEVGPKTLEFRVVNEANAIVWGPQTFEELPLQQGKFNVLLGSDDDGTTISLAFQGAGDAARYLSVKVAGELSERLPLQRVASVPYTLLAKRVPNGSINDQSIAEGSITGRSLAGFSPVVSASTLEPDLPSFDLRQAIHTGGFERLPNLSVTLETSGNGRPVQVGFRRKCTPLPSSSAEMAAPDFMVSGSNARANGVVGIQVEETQKLYGTSFSTGAGAGFRHSIQASTFTFIVDVPQGTESLTIHGVFNWSFFTTIGSIDELTMAGDMEMYAFEL